MISKEDILKEIFENDPLGLLNVKPKKSSMPITGVFPKMSLAYSRLQIL